MTRAAGALLAAAFVLASGRADADEATKPESGTVAFVVRDLAGNDVDAKVTIDDGSAPITLGRSIALDPGVHDVRWSTASGASGVQKITVVEGQRGRVFLLTADVRPVVPPEPQAPSPAVTRDAPSTPWPYVLIGAGATLAVTSAIFQLVAINEDSDSQQYFWHSTRDDLSKSTTDALARSGQSHYDAAKTDQAIAITCGVLAVAAVAAGVTWLVVKPSARVSASGAALRGTF